ncbi:hypothetical protein SLEP1_g50021 [Rubroshorea leprosula]|uniref:ATP-dependent RNA helicase n=1 Tax=Rubroshorea leprosula TaxID=152421 RepID=A0AAV5M0P8_9ROSI|nr:hypothetical protein SLEP1_g50021 [Rubroshorea leprosula]
MRKPNSRSVRKHNRKLGAEEIELLNQWIDCKTPDSGSNPFIASLPHALWGRDILGTAKTGSGKTLAFVIPVMEKLYKERWGLEDGVGSIIISPARELAGQLFDVLRTAGKHYNFSAGLLIGGRKSVHTEKERVNELNILL